jgi:methylated-DNA-[protein]-cysteine S-methyltransferase
MNDYFLMQTAVGELVIVANKHNITGLYPQMHRYFKHAQAESNLAKTDILLEAARQLEQYFAGKIEEFNLQLSPNGTPFQQRTWQELQNIPYGATSNYSSIANNVANPKAHRAVGTAIGRNPISIIIPCHRVLAKSRALAGYAGGVDMKQWLLSHEKSALH